MTPKKFHKKAVGNVISMFEYWAEVFFFILLALGFIIALSARNAATTYVIVFLCGMMSGRLMWQRREKIVFPYYIILIGFIIGFILGSRFGNKSVLITLFIIGAFASYYIHDRGLLHDLPF